MFEVRVFLLNTTGQSVLFVEETSVPDEKSQTNFSP